MTMKHHAFGAVLAGAALAFAGPASAAEPESCRTVRIGDVGWTDNQVVNGVAVTILGALGYETEVSLLSMSVILEALKVKDLDVHLDFWTPGADALTDPYLAEGAIENVGTYLTGAQYTLAVPRATWEAGLKSFEDIDRFHDELGGEIYGLEPGNDGNKIVLQMIQDDTFGLGDFNLVESSEQGMLAELTRKEQDGEPIVFLGWSPHPMNEQHDMEYLTGGEALFGSESSGWIATRAGYTEECPNVGRFLSNLRLDIGMMNQVMGAILNEGQPETEAAAAWMRDHPDAVEAWLSGVTTFDGEPAAGPVQAMLGN
jgi:glycine betaine/proline transport system substrate-binding protein